jgi:hypothetical protein
VERFLMLTPGTPRSSSLRFALAMMFDLAGFIRMRLRMPALMIDDIGVDTYSDERFQLPPLGAPEEPDYGRHVHAIALERIVRRTDACFILGSVLHLLDKRSRRDWKNATRRRQQ